MRAVIFTLLSTLQLLFVGCSSSDDKGSTKPVKMTTTGSDAGDMGTTSTESGPEPKLPTAPATCPQLVTGMTNIMGENVELFVGEKQTDKKGPLLLYWHGTGSTADEIKAFMPTQLAEIQASGGLAASWADSTMMGTNTGNGVWFTGDYDVADVIVACAIQQLNIDPRRIYAAGCSAGGLQSGSMAFARSSYLAAAMPNSGGDILITTFDDPTHMPSVITAHGSYAADFVFIHFQDTSFAEDQTIAKMGGFAIDCNHGGGHCGAPQNLIAAQWQFLKDHPFGVQADPYANGLPSTFPSYCMPITATTPAPMQ